LTECAHARDHFGERVAARYDESAADMFEPAVLDPAVDFLADVAGHGVALELGISTGRIALPLSARALERLETGSRLRALTPTVRCVSRLAVAL
jgi:hypothetical protein